MQAIKEWILRHPSLTAWLVLALGMNAILIYEARDVGLLPMQWFWLILITTLVAGACIWIVSWGDKDEPVIDTSTSTFADASAINSRAADEARTDG